MNAVYFSLLVIVAVCGTIEGAGESCVAIGVPNGVCSPASSCPSISAGIANDCANVGELCCPTDGSGVADNYSGACVAYTQPNGQCVGLTDCLQNINSDIGTCPLGKVCCGTGLETAPATGRACVALHVPSGTCQDAVNCLLPKIGVPGGTCPPSQLCCGSPHL